MWLILIVFASSSMALVVDTKDECFAFAQMNTEYWLGTHQIVQAACMPVFDV